MKNKSKWILGGICLSLFLFINLIYSFRITIMMQAGKFMAPDGKYTADIAILEGTEFIDRGVVTCGMNLLTAGKVKRIVVVLYSIAPSGRPFAISKDYPNLVKKEIEASGLKDKDFKVIVTHIHHPETLIAAIGALKILSKENIKSAILLSPGFHTRRSFLIYQHVATSYQIKIFPYACFDSYQLDHWWSQESGVRDFATELLELAYYLAKGYIPPRFSYSL